MKTMVHVKPVKPNDESTGWIVTQGTAWTEFVDDFRRYGLRVALYNLAIMLGLWSLR